MSDKPQKEPSSVLRLDPASRAALARIEAGRTRVNLDAVDFAPMLALVKPLSALTGQLAEWEHDGHLGPTGADMYFRIGEQWTALESAIVAAGLAHSNPLWIVGDKRRMTAVEALLELLRDRRTGYIGHEPIRVRFSNEEAEIGEKELEEAADIETRTPFTSAVQAKRLGLAAAMLEGLQIGKPAGRRGRPRRTATTQERQKKIADDWYRFYDDGSHKEHKEEGTAKQQYCEQFNVDPDKLEAALRQNRRKKTESNTRKNERREDARK